MRVGLVVASTLIGVIVADFALGLVQPPRLLGKRQLLPHNQPFGFHCYPTNPHGELPPAPEPGPDWKLFDVTVPPTPVPLSQLSETPWCVRYHLTEQGLRDRVYPPSPATGTVRVLGVGDSFAIGEGVPQDKGLFAQLAREIGKKVPKPLPRVEVMNAGRSGFDTAREVRLAQQLVPKLKADRVLLVWLLNDIRLSPQLRAEQRWINDLINVREAQLWRGEERPWWHRSRLLRWLVAWSEMKAITQKTVAGYQKAWSPQHNRENLAHFQAQLRALAAMQQPHKIKVAVVLYPLLIDLHDYPFAPIHARVATMVKQAGLPVLDLASTFAGHDPKALHVHPTDHHPNGRAHGIAAKAIAAWLPTLDRFL